MTHGIYTKHLSSDEQTAWDAIPIGTVDDEIRLCRIKICRALEAQKAVAVAPASSKNLAGMEISELRHSDMGTQAVVKRSDFAGIIDRLMGRLGQLEKLRSELLAAAKASGEGDAKPLPWSD